jgi:hypothetical protein
VAHYNGDNLDCAASNLRWDTRVGNFADKKRHGTENVGERNGGCKLTEAQARAILLDTGRSYSIIAADYGVSPGIVGKIKRREKWAHL